MHVLCLQEVKDARQKVSQSSRLCHARPSDTAVDVAVHQHSIGAASGRSVGTLAESYHPLCTSLLMLATSHLAASEDMKSVQLAGCMCVHVHASVLLWECELNARTQMLF